MSACSWHTIWTNYVSIVLRWHSNVFFPTPFWLEILKVFRLSLCLLLPSGGDVGGGGGGVAQGCPSRGGIGGSFLPKWCIIDNIFHLTMDRMTHMTENVTLLVLHSGKHATSCLKKIHFEQKNPHKNLTSFRSCKGGTFVKGFFTKQYFGI